MKKHFYLGKTNEGKVYVTVELKNDDYHTNALSLTGVTGPRNNGDAVSCGQINLHLKPTTFVKFAKGWDAKKVKHLMSVWEQYHLKQNTPNEVIQLLTSWEENGHDLFDCWKR